MRGPGGGEHNCQETRRENAADQIVDEYPVLKKLSNPALSLYDSQSQEREASGHEVEGRAEQSSRIRREDECPHYRHPVARDSGPIPSRQATGVSTRKRSPFSAIALRPIVTARLRNSGVYRRWL